MAENTFLRELLGLLPFLILHLSSGINGNFTTVLIKHYNDLARAEGEEEDSVVDAVIGIIQDIPPIVFAIAGGFLQQKFGPKKLLISSAVPSILSWVVVALWSSSFSAILASRLLAGLANGLLTGNSYLADMASNNNRSSLKMVELAIKNLGGILMFVGMISLSHLNLTISSVSWVFLVFPVLGFLGMFISRESPIFEERKKTGKTGKNLNPLKIPISSPTVFRPLILITLLTCLLQCSGSVFIKKFMIQILDHNTGVLQEDVNPTEPDEDLYFSPPLVTRNQTEVTEKNHNDDDLEYGLPLIILVVRLLVIFLMAFMVKKLRVRFLYFLSLFTTLVLLVCLALVSDPEQIGLDISVTTLKLIRTVIICLHVFFIQLGVNTLPQLLEITIFPSSCQAAMKGIMRAIASLILVLFVFVFKTLQYSHTFYLMAAILLVSSPLLYLFVPEIRNIGSDTSAEFFLPTQTIFYFFPPKCSRKYRNKEALDHWKSAVSKINAFKGLTKRQVSQAIDVEENSQEFPKLKFAEGITDLEEVNHNIELSPKKNKERVHFVSNILSQNNPLLAHPSKQRVLIGKGPIELKNEILKAGSIFLFNDLLIVATRVVSNRRFVREVAFWRNELTIVQSEENITLSDLNGKQLEISFEESKLAELWEQYISFKPQQES